MNIRNLCYSYTSTSIVSNFTSINIYSPFKLVEIIFSIVLAVSLVKNIYTFYILYPKTSTFAGMLLKCMAAFIPCISLYHLSFTGRYRGNIIYVYDHKSHNVTNVIKEFYEFLTHLVGEINRTG